MSVLGFGVPHREGLRCDHPVCMEYATHRLLFKAFSTPKGDQPERETFACNDHAAQLQIGQPIERVEKLKVAGERNRAVEK